MLNWRHGSIGTCRYSRDAASNYPGGNRRQPTFFWDENYAAQLGDCHLLDRNLWKAGPFRRMLDGHAHEVAILIQVDINVFTDLASFRDLPVTKLQEGCIAVLKILDLHVSTRTKVFIEERIVNCFTIRQCDHSQKFASFLNPRPSSHPAVRLDLRRDRRPESPFDPFDPYPGPVGSLPGVAKVRCRFHSPTSPTASIP